MSIVNLTPHPITLRVPCSCDGCSGHEVMHRGQSPSCDGWRDVTLPSTGVARVSSTPGALANIGLPVPVASATVYGDVTGLPAPSVSCACGNGYDCPSYDGHPEACPHYEATYFVVSALVGAALRASGSTRTDVLCPGTGPNDGAIRNAAGNVVAVTRLVRP